MKKRFQILAFALPFLFLLDQGVKLLIVHRLAVGEVVPILPGLFDIVHVTNRGAAFGFLSNLPDPLRVPFFHVTSAIALLAILIYFVRLKSEAKSPFVALSLIMGGAAGNIFDRIVRGEVVDFISLHWYDAWATILRWHFKLEWPAFNMADMAISGSVAWLLIQSFRKK